MFNPTSFHIQRVPAVRNEVQDEANNMLGKDCLRVIVLLDDIHERIRRHYRDDTIVALAPSRKSCAKLRPRILVLSKRTLAKDRLVLLRRTVITTYSIHCFPSCFSFP
jgi:hypothetical protein